MENITITISQVIMIVTSIATLLASLAIIFKYINKVKKTFEERLEKAIEKVVLDSNKRQDERTYLLLQGLKESISLEIKNVQEKIIEYSKQYTQDKNENWSIIQLLKEGLIEAYKNDIRTIYYKLRDTGEITDADKSYIDKIFPKYSAIGGNSDIQAKYEEISRVYERRTQEKYDEAFKKTKKTKKEIKIDTEYNELQK
jgi:hypothetical protein